MSDDLNVQDIEQEADLGNEPAETIEPQEAETSSEETETLETDEVNETDEGTEVDVPSYKPSFSYKVYGETHEFDDFLKDVVKDETSEQKIRELYEKAKGLDMVKPKYETVKNEFHTIKKDYSQLKTRADRVEAYSKEKDIAGLIHELKIPEESIYQYALEVAKRQDLSPEERAVYEEREQYKRKYIDLEQQSKVYQEQYEQQQRQEIINRNEQELNQVLGREDISAVVGEYDGKFGEGAFKRNVYRLGKLAYIEENKDYTAEEAVGVMLQELGYIKNQVPVAPQPVNTGFNIPRLNVTSMNTQTQQTAPVVDDSPKPIIPNVGSGTSKSPTRKRFNSIQDLRKYADQRIKS